MLVLLDLFYIYADKEKPYQPPVRSTEQVRYSMKICDLRALAVVSCHFSIDPIPLRNVL